MKTCPKLQAYMKKYNMQKKEQNHKTLLLSISIRNWVESRNFDYWLALNIIKPKLERFRDLAGKELLHVLKPFCSSRLKVAAAKSSKARRKIIQANAKIGKNSFVCTIASQRKAFKDNNVVWSIIILWICILRDHLCTDSEEIHSKFWV